MIPALVTRAKPLRIGHMGAAGLAPANSLAAIEAALRIGVDLIELDVWQTLDGELLLAHFNWLPPEQERRGGLRALQPSWFRTVRTWRSWPRVTDSTLADLQRLPAPPARLEDALDLMRGHAIPYLDLRGSSPIYTNRLCAVLRAGAPDGALLGAGPQRSFLPELELLPALRATSGVSLPLFARAVSPATLIRLARAAIRRARRMGATGLSVGYRLVRPELLEVCRQEGFTVFAWTVNDPREMRRLLTLGVDGITTDRPDLLAEVLEVRR